MLHVAVINYDYSLLLIMLARYAIYKKLWSIIIFFQSQILLYM